MFKCKFCQIDGHSEVDCRKKKSESKDKKCNKDRASKDKDTKASKSVFFSKSSAPATADSDSKDEYFEPGRAYVVSVTRTTPEVNEVYDEVPVLID